jgi:hypothetical protein
LKAQNDIDKGQWLRALQNAHHRASTRSSLLEDEHHDFNLKYSAIDFEKMSERLDDELNNMYIF